MENADQRGGPGRVAFLGLGIMGWPMAANLARRGLRARRLDPHRREGRALRRRARRRGGGHPGRGRRGRRRGHHHGRRRPRGRGGAARRRRRRRARSRRARSASTCPRSPRARPSRIGERLRERGLASWTPPSPARGPGPRTARSRSWSGAEERDFERARPLFEAMGELRRARGPAGARRDDQADHQHRGRDQRGGAGRGAGDGGPRPGVDADAFLEVAGSGSSASTMLELKARPMLDGDFEPLFKLEHMLKDVRHCLAEAQRAGRRAAPGRGGRAALRRGGGRAGTARAGLRGGGDRRGLIAARAPSTKILKLRRAFARMPRPAPA